MFRVDRYEESDEEHISNNNDVTLKKTSIAEIARQKIKSKSKKRAISPVDTESNQITLDSDKLDLIATTENSKSEGSTKSSIKEKKASKDKKPKHEKKVSEELSRENDETQNLSDSESQNESIALRNNDADTGYLPVFQSFNEGEEEDRRLKFKKSKLGLPSWLASPKIVQSQSSEPISKLEGKLNSHLLDRCKKLDITDLFAVQMAVIDHLALSQHPYSERFSPGDLCVSAPTGSGKTLAYVLPIVHRLIGRTVTRLRALILVPTRDLMVQVKEVFDFFCYGTSLKVGSFSKSFSFNTEQQRLVNNFHEGLCGGSSNIDILISTPGRLLDHLKETPNFSLQHLRFLVVDEADRLLSENFNEWLPSVMDALDKSPSIPSTRSLDLLKTLPYKPLSFGGCGPIGLPLLSHDAIGQHDFFKDSYCLFSHSAPQIQKLLFSATLTRNPGKIANLRLQNPAYISVQVSLDEDASRYCTPASLKEVFIVGSGAYKPLLLLFMLLKYKVTNAIVFTKSVEASTRLYHFIKVYVESLSANSSPETADSEHTKTLNSEQIEYLKKLEVAFFSSELSRVNRQKKLKEFKAGLIHILVCSDLLARGLDVEGVAAVINYDSPYFIKQYIHRVGRTARAGQPGLAITLLAPNEVTPFKIMQDKGNRRNILQKDHVERSEFELLKSNYMPSLQKVENIINQKDTQ